jgi:hypothetical protein
LGISRQLSCTLLPVASNGPAAFQSISQRLLAKTKQFLFTFFEAAFLHFLILKIEGTQENFKTLLRLLS